jgi:hypothetical protein
MMTLFNPQKTVIMKIMTQTLRFTLAIGTLLLVGCAKSEITQTAEPTENIVEVTISASSDNDTRTYLDPLTDGVFPSKWSEGDKLGVYAKGGPFDMAVNVPFTLLATSASGVGYFSGTLNTKDVKDSYTKNYYAYYPYNSSANYSKPDAIVIPLPQTQYPTMSSFDPKADILFGRPIINNNPVPSTIDEVGSLSFQFARAVAIGSFKVSNASEYYGAKVLQVFLQFGSSVVSNYLTADLTKDEPTYTFDSKSGTNTITLDYTTSNVTLNDDFTAWWTMIPGETTLTRFAVMCSDSGGTFIFNRSMSAPFNFQRGKVTTAAVNLAGTIMR